MDISRFAQMAAGRLTVRSALNPLLWLCGIVTVPCFTLAATLHDARLWVFAFAGFIPLAVTCIIAIRFAFYSPEKLQSEDYQLRHQSLQMLQSATGPQPVEVVDALVAISNPVAPTPAALPPASDTAPVEPAANEGGVER